MKYNELKPGEIFNWVDSTIVNARAMRNRSGMALWDDEEDTCGHTWIEGPDLGAYFPYNESNSNREVTLK